jgi:hypothetical protein
VGATDAWQIVILKWRDLCKQKCDSRKVKGSFKKLPVMSQKALDGV